MKGVGGDCQQRKGGGRRSNDGEEGLYSLQGALTCSLGYCLTRTHYACRIMFVERDSNRRTFEP